MDVICVCPQVRGGHDAGAEQPAAGQVRRAEEAALQAQGRHLQGGPTGFNTRN